jgi:hypothetical protein
MQKIFLICSLFLSMMLSSYGQSPVKWTFETKQVNGDTYMITATADMGQAWVIYSQHTPDDGPIPTAFMVGDKEVKFEEKTKVIKENDPMFGVDVLKFKHTAVFTYTFTKDPKISGGDVTFMTCDGSRCLPPATVPFKIQY